jgi:hypothetical protein
LILSLSLVSPASRKSNVKQKMLLHALAKDTGLTVTLDHVNQSNSTGAVATNDIADEATANAPSACLSTSPRHVLSGAREGERERRMSPRLPYVPQTPSASNNNNNIPIVPSHQPIPHRSSAPRSDVSNRNPEPSSLVSQLMKNLPQLPSIPQAPMLSSTSMLAPSMPASSISAGVSPREHVGVTVNDNAWALEERSNIENAMTAIENGPHASAVSGARHFSLSATVDPLPEAVPTANTINESGPPSYAPQQQVVPARRGSLRRSTSNNELINARAQKRRDSSARANTAIDINVTQPASSQQLQQQQAFESDDQQELQSPHSLSQSNDASSSPARLSVTAPPNHVPRVSRGRKEHAVSRGQATAGLKGDDGSEKRADNFQKIGKLHNLSEKLEEETFENGSGSVGVDTMTPHAAVSLSSSDTLVTSAKKSSSTGNRSSSSSPSLRLLKQLHQPSNATHSNASSNPVSPSNNPNNPTIPEQQPQQQLVVMPMPPPKERDREKEVRESGKVGRRRTDDVAKLNKLSAFSSTPDKDDAHGHAQAHEGGGGDGGRTRCSSQKRKKATSVNTEHASVISHRNNNSNASSDLTNLNQSTLPAIPSGPPSSSSNPSNTNTAVPTEATSGANNNTNLNALISPRVAVQPSRRLQLPRKTSGNQFTSRITAMTDNATDGK